MLILTRRIGESIRVGEDIVITLVQTSPGKVRIGVEAPPGCLILREELVGRKTATAVPAALGPRAAPMADPANMVAES